jgi:hypothetical protein
MSPRARKQTVDQRVALALNVPISTVRIVTECFLRESIECLAEYGCLLLENFGRLTVTHWGGRAHHIQFVKSTNLAAALRPQQGDDHG